MKLLYSSIALLLLLLKLGHAATTPLKCQESKMEQVCTDIIENDKSHLPGFVRLAFHDCVGPNGCNGCVDLKNPDNGGLQKYIDSLDDKYADHHVRDIMSRADFWILCSHVALRMGLVESGKTVDADNLNLNMVYGREDCHDTNSDQPAPNDKYPSPHKNHSDTTNYFENEFGLNADETVALMGAHTLGRARPSGSGFRNAWVDKEHALDNQFYKDVKDRSLDWTLVDLSDEDQTKSHPQWSQNHSGHYHNLMFSSDVSMVYDVQPDSDGMVNKTYRELERSPGYDQVAKYAMDNARWLRDFSEAYKKMVKKLPANSKIVLQLAKLDEDNPVCKDPIDPPPPQRSDTTTAGSGRNQAISFFVFGVAVFLSVIY